MAQSIFKTECANGANARSASLFAMRNVAAFSLIELMIVMAIIAILVGATYPSYTRHVRRSHRAEAVVTLLRIAVEQEKFYSQHNAYATTEQLAARGLGQSEHGWYVVTVAPAADGLNSGFIATAQAIGVQAIDADCERFTLDHTGAKDAFLAHSSTSNRALCWR